MLDVHIPCWLKQAEQLSTADFAAFATQRQVHAVQGGVDLLVQFLDGSECHQEAAAWALKRVISLQPSCQAAALQAGAMPKLVRLLEHGPDSAIASSAADCLCSLAQVASG